jgi:hypothetical protein
MRAIGSRNLRRLFALVAVGMLISAEACAPAKGPISPAIEITSPWEPL